MGSNSSGRKFTYSRAIVYFTGIAVAAFVVSAILTLFSNILSDLLNLPSNLFLEGAQWVTVIGFFAVLGAVFSITKVALTLAAVGHTILRLTHYRSK
jgi:hypothetical protein